MAPKVFPSRSAAIDAALEMAGKHLRRDEEICLKIFHGIGVITLYELKGRSRVVLGRFPWVRRGA